MALTRDGISTITNAVQKIVDFAVNDLEERISSMINHLPTKEEFYGSMDQIMGELKAIRENHDVLGGRVSIHSDQIAALEKLHPGGKHISP